jgi:hypothetical protein
MRGSSLLPPVSQQVDELRVLELDLAPN